MIHKDGNSTFDVAFRNSILTLTSEDDLAKARNRFRVADRITGTGVCAFCNQRIQHLVLLELVGGKRDVRMHVGRDCYTKLVIFNKFGFVHAVTSPKVKQMKLEHTQELIAAMKQGKEKKPNIGQLEKWLGREQDSLREQKRKLPTLVKEGLDQLGAIGYPATKEHADAILDYYKAHRKFDVESILTVEERNLYVAYRNDCKIDREVTLAELPRIRGLLVDARSRRKSAWDALWAEIQERGLTTANGVLRYTYLTSVGTPLFTMRYAGHDLDFAFAAIASREETLRDAPEVLHFDSAKFIPESRCATLVLAAASAEAWRECTRAKARLDLSARREEARRKEEERVAKVAARQAEWAALARTLPSTFPLLDFRVEYGMDSILLKRELGNFSLSVEITIPVGIAPKFYKTSAPAELAFRKLEMDAQTGYVSAEVDSTQIAAWKHRASAAFRSASDEHRKLIEQRIAEMVQIGRILRSHFTLCQHPKTMEEQWQFLDERTRRKYVLAREDRRAAAQSTSKVFLHYPSRILAGNFLYLSYIVRMEPQSDGTWIAYYLPRGIRMIIARSE